MRSFRISNGILLHLQRQNVIRESILLNYVSPGRSTNYVLLSTETKTSEGEKFDQHLNQTTRVLYDGECKLCKVEISGLKWLARNKPDVEFVDITSHDYSPSSYSGVTYEQAMKEMHVVGPQGQVFTQGDAIRHMYRASGLGWLASLTELPGIKGTCDKMYIRFAHYRLQKAFARCDSESDRCSIKLHNLRKKMQDVS